MFIPDEPIEVFPCPNGAAPVFCFVDFLCRKRFPRSHNFRQLKSDNLLNHHMHMIWHHDPRDHAVAVTVKMRKRVLDNFDVLGLAKKA